MSEKDVESRLGLVEDRSRIESLVASYAFSIDTGWAGAGADPTHVADLFTEDAELISDDQDAVVGRPAILAWAEGVASMDGLLVSHVLATPQIEITGDEAKGRWHAIVGMRIGEAAPAWLVGNYEYRFARTVDGWKIRRQHFRTAFQAAFDGSNWAPGPLPS
jgi:ketosteroid isomerase-like protein